MYAYQVSIKGEFFTLFNEKHFEEDEIESMVNQAVSELKWGGIRRTYGNEVNYLNDHFGFWLRA